MIWFTSQRADYYIGLMDKKRFDAKAELKGSPEYPDLHGAVRFLQTKDGVLVMAEVIGLPHQNNACAGSVFAFHIHEGTSCTGTPEDPFADTKGHINPNSCPHPYHAGDMPPLFEAQGRAFMTFLTDRFQVADIIGRTVILHAGLDDFTSQPSGNAGKKIACGVIRK